MNEQIKYTVYEKATGRILRVLMAHDEASAFLNVKEGEGIIWRALDPSVHYIRGGRVMEYTAAEQDRYKARPTLRHKWNIERRRWDESLTREELRDLQRKGLVRQMLEIEAGQDRALREAIMTGDKTRLRRIEDQLIALRDALAKLK